MQFLTLLLYAGSLFLVWKKPEREGLAWALCLAATFIMIMMYSIASWNSFLPWLFY